MKRTYLQHFAVMLWALLLAGLAVGQPTPQPASGEFIVKKLKRYWVDKNQRPWSDLGHKMAVRIDPQFAADLGADEISSNDNPPVKFTTAWQLFTLQTDAQGTFAEVPYLVYKDKPDPIIYQIELQKDGRGFMFTKGASSRDEVRNDSANPRTLGLSEANPILLKDWLIIIGTLLLSGIFIYVVVFRWLFKSLLDRGWAINSAENFTWSLSLLLWFMVGLTLTILYLGLRLETYIISGMLLFFWLMHAIVWLIAKK